MILMMISFIIMSIISMLIIKISMIFSKKTKLNLEKMSPFECGFNPINNTRIPFSFRFFLITIIFLIFDIEITLLLPMIFTIKFSKLKIWLITSMIFLITLIIGLFHEWNQGILNWQ